MGRRCVEAPPVSVFCLIRRAAWAHVCVCCLVLIRLCCVLHVKSSDVGFYSNSSEMTHFFFSSVLLPFSDHYFNLLTGYFSTL